MPTVSTSCSKHLSLAIRELCQSDSTYCQQAHSLLLLEDSPVSCKWLACWPEQVDVGEAVAHGAAIEAARLSGVLQTALSDEQTHASLFRLRSIGTIDGV